MPTQSDEKKAQDAQLKELEDLWQRRDRLNESEWTKLYELIYRSLCTKRGGFGSWLKHVPNEDLNVQKNSEFSSKFEAYVWEFYLEKMIRACEDKQSVDKNQKISKAYFREAFKNFLIDKGRYFNNRPWTTQSDEINPHNPQENDEDLDIFERLSENKIDPDWRPSPEQKWILWNFGLDLATVTTSVRDFFNRLTQEDRNLFKEHFIEGKTLKDLKEQMPNTNIYYAASRLGISKNKKQFPSYYKTRIGQWLADLGLFLNLREPDSHEREVLFIVLQILRACALDGVDADHTSGSGPDDPSPDA